MKTPREIVNEALKGDLEPPIEYQSYEDAVLHAMKEYAKMWVKKVLEETHETYMTATVEDYLNQINKQ